MTTTVSVHTYAQNVRFVVTKVMSSLKDLIVRVGLDPDPFVSSWAFFENGLRTWMEGRWLVGVHLEIFDPSTGSLIGRWDIDIVYEQRELGDDEMWADPDAIRTAIAKAGKVPKQCKYELILSNKDGRPDIEGWTKRDFRSTESLSRFAVGRTVSTADVIASAAFWGKTP